MYSVLIVLLLIMTVNAAGEKTYFGEVSFSWGRSFTLTCPKMGDWFLNGKPNETNTWTLNHRYDEDLKALHYYCKYDNNGDTKFYHFYVRGKACDWCVEVTTGAVLGVLCGDVLLTGLVILAVYLRTKHNHNNNNHPTGPAAASRPAGGRRRRDARGGPPPL